MPQLPIGDKGESSPFHTKQPSEIHISIHDHNFLHLFFSKICTNLTSFPSSLDQLSYGTLKIIIFSHMLTCPELCFCAFKLFLRLLFSYQSLSAWKKCLIFLSSASTGIIILKVFRKCQLSSVRSGHILSLKEVSLFKADECSHIFLSPVFCFLTVCQNLCLLCLNGVLVMLLWHVDDSGWDPHLQSLFLQRHMLGKWFS